MSQTPGHYKKQPCIKESLCYVALDFDKEMENYTSPSEYKLPDEKVLYVGHQRFSCPEAMFQPSFICDGTSSTLNGIHEACYKVTCVFNIHVFVYPVVTKRM